MAPQFKQKDINVKLSFEDNLPYISADPNKIEQVFMNILSNALKFTPSEGTVQITIKRSNAAVGTKPEVEGVLSIITNDGPGILPEELPTIFERYKQGLSSESVQVKGTGLGLEICKLIVEAHGGNITAESEPEKLTTFQFWLPIQPPDES
jgi:signal transduction histidine kinase